MTKICSKCNMEFPATFDFFNYHYHTKNSLDSKCKNCKKKHNQEYYKKNKNKIIKQSIMYEKERLKIDEHFAIKKRLRRRIRSAIKKQSGFKSAISESLLGCKMSAFKRYFQKLFTEGMTWAKFLDGQIHIDHIIPCSKFDLTDVFQQNICFNYRNLQPLWASDNIKKKNHITNPMQNLLSFAETKGAQT